MDINTLLVEAKARFSHNAGKHYLNEKYNNKLILADQGGLWKADKETIGILNALDTDTAILIDTFGNPVEVNRQDLLEKLINVYTEVMSEWYKEAKELEVKR